jgi:hypothetical protein
MQDMTDNRKVIAHFLLTGRFNLTNIGLVITGKFVDGDFVEDKNYICIAGAPLQVTNRYAYILNLNDTDLPKACASSGSISGPLPCCIHTLRSSFCKVIVSPFSKISSSLVVLFIGDVLTW